MNHLTLKDRHEMRYMGYTLRAWYLNPFGVPFHKDFPTEEKMEDFNRRAHEVGTKFLGFVSL